MSDTVDIGAARVRLIVDAADFEAVVQQGKRAITGFGDVAQQAYDRTEKGTRRAADALLDYVNSLGRADTTMDRYIRTASRMGVEKPILDAAITAWARHNDEVEQAAAAQADNEAAIKKASAAYKELVDTQVKMELQARKVAEAQAAQNFNNIQQARAANSQQAFNTVLGVSMPTVDYERRQAAEEVFAELVARENSELEQQKELTNAIATSRSQQEALNAQQTFNSLLGIGNSEQQTSIALAQRRNDAMAAFLPMLEEEARAESENSQLVQKQQAFIQQLENTAATAGKTYYEMLQLRAAELGLGEAYQPLISKIKTQNEAMGAGTLSAKQYEFALRGLPAQFTDVVVSLQAGQRPLTVLLQQGGQIKDMFGGVGNAVRVVGREVVKIATSPLFILAGVAALVATAFAEATSRTTDFAVAAAKGNLVAGNAKGLASLADQLSKLNNISIGHADEAVQSLAAAGKLTGDNFAIAAQAAARWSTITGQAADDIIGKFNELANDPMAAVLNGTLKVTEAQYEQLAAFERTGQKAKEAQLAVKLYADQINNDSASVLENLSAGQKGWIDLKEAITSAWHEFSGFISDVAGKGFTGIKQFASDFSAVLHPKTGGVGTSLFNAFVGINTDEQPAWNPSMMSGGGMPTPAAIAAGTTPTQQAAQAKAAALTTDQVNANKELQKSIDELGTKQQKFSAALQLENGLLSRASDGYLKQAGIVKSLAGTFSGPGYDKLVKGLRLKIFGENEGGDPTKPIKEWEKTALDSLKAVQEADDNLYKNHLVSIDTFYAISEGLVRSDSVIQLEAIDKQIKALQGRANSESSIAALKQQRSTVEVEQTAKLTKLENERTDALKAQRIEYENYVDALAKANIQISRQGDQAARGVGMGDRQSALANAQDNARYGTAQNIQDIQRQIDNGQIDPAQGLKEQDAAAQSLATTLTLLQGNYDSLSTAQSSWQNGATKAWQNFSDNVSNVAEQTGTLVTGVLNDLTTMFQDLVKNGHLSMQKLIADVLAQIEKAGIQYALQQAFKLLGGSSGGGTAGGAASGIGGLVSLFSGSFGGGFFAQGGVFPAYTGLSAYRNSIVTAPTVFPFAKGGVPNVGVMGEAGAEGIFPLTRTSGGELGVKAVGHNQATRVTNVNQTIVVPGANTRATQDQTAIKVYGAAQRAARRS